MHDWQWWQGKLGKHNSIKGTLARRLGIYTKLLNSIKKVFERKKCLDPSTSGGIKQSFKVCARVMKALLRFWHFSERLRRPKANILNESLVKANSITPQLSLSNQDSGLSGL